MARDRPQLRRLREPGRPLRRGRALSHLEGGAQLEGLTTSPDGRVWTVSVSRFRTPPWRQSDYEPESDDLFVVLEYAAALVLWFVVPLLVAIVELPVALVRGVFSSRRWIEAASDDFTPITILWSAHRRDADRVAGEIADRLSRGYEDVTPGGAILVEMSAPPGLRDL